MAETTAPLPGTVVDATLPNGLRFVGERMERSEAVALAVRVCGGSKDDPPNKLGLASLVQETLFKGTRKHDARALSDAFDFYGIQHNEQTLTESTVLQLRCLPEHLGKALELLREVLSQPSFPEKECATARTLAVQSLKRLEDEPLSKVFVLLKELYFGTEWGHVELGREATVPEVSRADIEAFWKAHYIPAGTVVSAAGKFDPAALQQQLETLLANSGPAWPHEEPPPPPAAPLRQHSYKDSQQTQLALAFPAVPRRHPAYYPARLAVGVLAGGMSARLFTEVREKRGLVYAVGAQAMSLRHSGAIYAFAGTTAPRAAETLQVLKAELARLGQDATQEETDRAKVGLKARLLMDQESTYQRSKEMLDDIFLEDRIVPVGETVQRIDAVTAEDVKVYWNSHPVEPCAMVVLGREPLG
ncbi:MAG: pitrilysin family protein [Planctomycetota bacterium]